MSAFLQKYNSDDVFFRAVSVGLINFMSERLTVWNVIDNEIVEYPVPFYYNAAGDERFMQDIFQQHTLNDCINNMMTEGNADIIPRGHVTLTSIVIQASELSNRFVRGEWTKIEDGEVMTYNSPMNIIPLQLGFDVEIKVEGLLMSFKLAQRIIQTFYKAYPFEFLWEGIPLKAAVAFPEDPGIENTYEFSFGDEKVNKLNFAVEVEAKLPVIDQTQTFLKSKRIENLNVEINPGNIFWPDKGLDGERLPADYKEVVVPTGAIVSTNQEASLTGDYVTSSASRIDYLESIFGTQDEKDQPGSHTNLGDPTSQK